MLLSVEALLEEVAIPFTPRSYRICPAEETVARFRPMAARLGITRIADVSGLDVIGVPVTMVVRPASRSLSVAQGKGISRADAVASGLMESIEAFHAERIEGPLLRGSHAELSTTRNLVEPELLPRLSGSIYSPHLPLLWIEGGDLLGGRPTWVPLEVVTLDFSWPRSSEFGCFTMTSNGLASGNNRLEAVLQGLCEVIERDAVVSWTLLPASDAEATRIDVDSIDDDVSQSLIGRIRKAGVGLTLWDVTSDIRVPVVQCCLVAGETGEIGFAEPCFGMGCHPDRDVALRRAILEAIQTRATFIAGSRDDIDASGYVPRFSRGERAGADATRNGARSFATLPHLEGRLDELLQSILAELARRGCRSAMAIDLTHDDVGAAVVRVVVPGLEGLRDGFPSGTEFVAVSGGRR